MLSPHEVAALILIKNAPDQTELERADIDALLEQELVSLEQLESGRHRPCVTARGGALLNAIARIW
ncbi:hypothetical protein P3W85_28715 [Cupriavidus basilensis]|uniref:Preprotein translocase subunit SecA n=1 Tax=Cupriavidus basilensis TaxID=68895 RepID=A0ABT6AW93_9BURK|nr:hypothetical protein [Cupriavidus basilensis]MDF3836903.1 hypothetical protein [Cupriavidus basilensis]